MAPAVGLEPTTDRLTADCSTTELRWNNEIVFITTKIKLQVLFFKKIIFFKFIYKKTIYPTIRLAQLTQLQLRPKRLPTLNRG